MLSWRLMVVGLSVGFGCFVSLPPALGLDTNKLCVERTLFPIVLNNSQGFIDRAGRMVIEPRFEGVAQFWNGLARASTLDGLGFLNTSGEWVLPPEFEVEPLAWMPEQTRYEEYFSEGLATIKLGGKCGYIDLKGKVVIEPSYDFCAAYFEGLAAVRIDEGEWGKWGYVDKKGQLVISPQFFTAQDFVEGVALVLTYKASGRRGKWGLLKADGTYLQEPIYDQAGTFSEGVAVVAVKNSNGKVLAGAIRPSGELVLEYRFADLMDYSQGLFAARQEGGAWGYVDLAGEWKIPPKYEAAYPFSEGLATVSVNGKYGSIDLEGNEVIPPQFESVFPYRFCGGLAQVTVGNWTDGHKHGYIDKTGGWVWEPSN